MCSCCVARLQAGFTAHTTPSCALLHRSAAGSRGCAGEPGAHCGPHPGESQELIIRRFVSNQIWEFKSTVSSDFTGWRLSWAARRNWPGECERIYRDTSVCVCFTLILCGIAYQREHVSNVCCMRANMSSLSTCLLLDHGNRERKRGTVSVLPETGPKGDRQDAE